MLVLGIDPGLVHTGIAAIEDGRAIWKSTLTVTGDAEDTGPRYCLLRECLDRLLRTTKKVDPAVIAIEQPELAIRKKREPSAILKLYGSFAVIYAECRRLFPKAHIFGPAADKWKGTMGKSLTARVFAAKYGFKTEDFQSDHESDALGLADLAWEYAQAKLREESRERDRRKKEEPPCTEKKPQRF